MTTNEQVKVTVSADTRPYETAMDRAATATTKVDKAAADLGTKASQNAIKWAAVGTAITVASGKMLREMNRAVQAASDLNESTTKMQTIFGDAADEIARFAEGSAEALGLSQRAALDAASTMATFGKAAGLTGQELATFSTDLVTLAGDLASFYNATPEDAALAIGAALRGEQEPIRRFGVLLDDMTLRTKALELGLISSVKNGLTPQQKALAAQASIMEQTRDAQGDFARTSDGLANSQRQMAAALEDARAAFGEALLPVMTQGVQAVTALAEVLAAMPEPLRNTVAGLTALAAVVGALAPAIIGASIALDKWTASATAATGATGRLATAVAALRAVAGPVALALTAVAAAAYGVHKSAEYQRGKGVDRMVEAMKEATAAGRDLDTAMTTTLGGGQVLTGIEDFMEALGRGKLVAGQTEDAFRALDEYLVSLSPAAGAAAYNDLADRVEAAGFSVADLNAQLPGFQAASSAAAQAAAGHADAEGERKAAVDAANQAITDAVSGMFAYINAMAAASGSADTLLGAADRLRSSMASTTVTASRAAAGRATASKAETAAIDKTIAKLREKDAAEVEAEIKAARRRAQRRAEERADAGARRDVQKGVADAIARDKAARRGEDLDGTGQTNSVGEATGSLSAAAQKKLDAEIERIRSRHKKALDAQVKSLEATRKATADVAAATSSASGALTVYNNTLDKTTEAGRQNRASIRAEVTNLTAAAQAVYDTAILNGATAEEAGRAAYDALIESRDGLLAMAVQAGYARADVKAFFDEIKFTEKIIRLKFELTGIDKASRDIDKLATKVGTLNKLKVAPKLLDLDPGQTIGGSNYSVPRNVPRYADGGPIHGSGGPRSDRVPIWASPGEYVVNAPQYAANRELVQAINAGTGRVNPGMTIGAVHVTEASPAGVRASVLDALAESAYRMGVVR